MRWLDYRRCDRVRDISRFGCITSGNMLGVPIGDVTIVYVVADDVDFTAPDIAGEANVVVVKIDCSSMESIYTSLEEMFTSVVHLTVPAA